jgi:hypothetical protein
MGADAAGAATDDVIFVLGGPGSGKGTQCALLAQRHGFAHFSAGDLLRDEVASGSAQRQAVQAMMNEGKIVPAEVTIGLLRKAIASRAGPYLIDGFPRSMDNATAYEKEVRAAPPPALAQNSPAPAGCACTWLTPVPPLLLPVDRSWAGRGAYSSSPSGSPSSSSGSSTAPRRAGARTTRSR